jgi:2-(1,2-epoxy-1,2-dihydrophenyl)acetyl-CoA isomerase
MISRVVPDADLLNQASAIAHELAQGPTQAFGGVKRLLYASPNNPLYEQMEIETATIADMSRTADAREGIAAFLGKRTAQFTGQ